MGESESPISARHRPVLLTEVVERLLVKPGELYIDGTLGQAGHARGIAQRGGKVLGIDANRATLVWTKSYLSGQKSDWASRITPVLGNFADIDKIAGEYLFAGVSGIIFDLGLSTFELESSGLGFSFNRNEPLDMRLDPTAQKSTASDLINGSTAGELYHILLKYGEEREAKGIVSAIIRGRGQKRIETTRDLVSLIESAYQSKGERYILNKHLAKIFQALRIAVNNELENLRISLPKALALLKPGGRLCVISFHSLEDRVVKKFFIEGQKKGGGKLIVDKPQTARRREIEENRSARSAKLRIFEKI